MEWTREQQAAISARNDTILVSAAAGSGKTAVLVERVVSLVREGIPIQQMLIVTFTRAAASEMRDRIEKRLRNDPDPKVRLQGPMTRQAVIATLHSFCQRFLREHFAAAGIDPMFRLGSESELAPLRAKAVEEALNQAWLSHSADTDELFRQFDFEELEDIIPVLQKFRASLENDRDPVRDMAVSGFAPFFQELKLAYEKRILGAGILLADMDKLLSAPGAPHRYRETYDRDCLLIRTMTSASREKPSDLAFARLSAKRPAEDEDPLVTEQYKALRDQWKTLIRSAFDLLPADQEAANRISDLSARFSLLIESIADTADQLFMQYKLGLNILDFNDLEHLTAQVLRDQAVRREAAEQYKAVFVDEFQDISGIQESIISSLHTAQVNTLFLVGDVKQSIYRFRLANPNLFMNKMERFSFDEAADERKILLNRNFRSDDNLIRCVNKVFRHAMRKSETEIEYNDEAELVAAPTAAEGAPVEIYIIRSAAEQSQDDSGEAYKAFEREAAFIAERINQLMAESALNGSAEPALRYRDIVILIRNASNRAPQVAEVLQSHGVPVFCDADSQFFKRQEIRDLIQLCKAICSPNDDFSLLSALRCPCFHFTADELGLIRAHQKNNSFFSAFLLSAEEDTPLGQRCLAVIRQLQAWRFLSRSISLDAFLWRIIYESGLYLKAGSGVLGEERRAALRVFSTTAQGDNTWKSLREYLDQIDSVIVSGDKTNVRELSDMDDLVRIMTLHKSKGLQFPVVFMMETARSFSRDKASLVQTHTDLGMAVRVINPEQRSIQTNYCMTAIKQRLVREQRAEECRLMYVGMTRAQKRLIILGSPKDPEAFLRNTADDLWHCGSADSMLQWIVNSIGAEAFKQKGLYRGASGETFFLDMPEVPESAKTERTDRISLPVIDLSPFDSSKETAVLSPDQAFRPPVLKSSVTAILKQLRQDADQEEGSGEKRHEPLPAPAPRPFFMRLNSDPTPAEKGSMIHRILSILDIDLLRHDGIDAAVEQLKYRHMLNPIELKLLSKQGSKEMLVGFFGSFLGKRMLKSSEIHREWTFTLHLDSEFAEYIQGIVDLCFLENGSWILCDYKTDHFDSEELLRRYRDQINLYRKAIETITGIPVRECFLYSLPYQRTIPVSASTAL